MKLTPPAPIGKDERKARIEKLCAEMDKEGIGAVLIGPTASLRYFTGVTWHPSERFTGALIFANEKARLSTSAPASSATRSRQSSAIEGDIRTGQEEESPYALDRTIVSATRATLAVDESVALFIWLKLRGCSMKCAAQWRRRAHQSPAAAEDQGRAGAAAICQGHHARGAAPRVEEPARRRPRQRSRSLHRP